VDASFFFLLFVLFVMFLFLQDVWQINLSTNCCFFTNSSQGKTLMLRRRCPCCFPAVAGVNQMWRNAGTDRSVGGEEGGPAMHPMNPTRRQIDSTKEKTQRYAKRAKFITGGTFVAACCALIGITMQDEQVYYRRHKAIAIDIAREKKRAAALGIEVPADDGFGAAYNMKTGTLDPAVAKKIEEDRVGDYERYYHNNKDALLQDKPLTLRAGYNAENPQDAL
jgi:hypothetical protein